MKYTLIGSDGQPYQSDTKGAYGGYKRGSYKIYGRLDCRVALMWIKKGHYIKYRVFFATKQDAEAAGFRPCKICKPE